MESIVLGLDPVDLFLILLTGLLVGMAKTGVPGVGLAIVPIMAGVFGARASTGYLLPILIMADVFAVIYYNRHAQWKLVFQLLPWAIIGIIAGSITGKYISDKLFGQLLSVLVIIGLVLMVYQDRQKNKMNIPDYWWFAALMGLAGGFSTMLGNAAGPIMALYLLAMRLPKNKFIGTGAWFFLIINVSKVPLHIFYWETINLQTFLTDLITLPAILLGVFAGIMVVKKINEGLFKTLIIVTTLITSLIILYKTFIS